MAPPAYELFGPIDAVLGNTATIEYILLALVLANMVTRILAHRRNVAEADEGGAEAMTRHPAHIASNVLLLVASFYYTSLHQHSGIVVTTLLLGVFLTDFFEHESRKVDARRDLEIQIPKGSITASLLTLLYVGYLSLFQFIAPVWNAVV